MRATIFDGVKGFDIPVNLDSDFGWDVYGNEIKDIELYKCVSVVYRAMNLNEGAVTSMPFAIYDSAGNEWDTSADYQNKLGFLPNPSALFGRWRKSLAFTNKAYGLFDKQRGKMELRYIAPNTITIDANETQGITGFWRTVKARRDYYPVTKNQVVYLHKTDFDTEILPSENTEFKALMKAAGVAYWSDHYVEEFFRRGGIKPHMLMVKGVPTKDERDRIENVWDKLMRGMRNYIGKVYNADAIEAKPIGVGVDDFKDNGFYKQALENVAMATGIPLSLLLSNSANLATARQEYKSWYDNGVIPWCNFIAGEFNHSVLDRFDLTLEFLTKSTDPDMEEEFRRANSFSVYAGVLLNNRNPKAVSIAAQIVGLDLPRDITYEDLDERTEPEEVEEPKPDTDNSESYKPPKQDDEYEAEDEEKSVRGFVPNAEQIKELKTWMDIAERKYKKGDGAPEWENKTIPVTIAASINERLSSAQSVEDVTLAFDLTQYTITQTPTAEYKGSDIMALAEAINKLAERTPDNASRNESTTPKDN
jgi:hypothetical protein